MTKFQNDNYGSQFFPTPPVAAVGRVRTSPSSGRRPKSISVFCSSNPPLPCAPGADHAAGETERVHFALDAPPGLRLDGRVAGLFSDNTLEQIRAASDIVDVIGGYLPLKRAGGELHGALPVSQGEVPQLQRQSPQADLPLLRLSQRRRRIHLRQGIREHRLRGRRAATGRARQDTHRSGAKSRRAGIASSQGSSCCRFTSRSPSAGKAAWPTKRPGSWRVTISPSAASRPRR